MSGGSPRSLALCLLAFIGACSADDPFVLSTGGAPSVLLGVDRGSALDLTAFAPESSAPILLESTLAESGLVDLTALLYEAPLSSLGLMEGPVLASTNETGPPLPVPDRVLRAAISAGEPEDWTEVDLPSKFAVLRRPEVSRCPIGASIEPIVLSPEGRLHWFAKVGRGLLAFDENRQIFEYTFDERILRGDLLDPNVPFDVITAGVGEALIMTAGPGGRVWYGSVTTVGTDMQPLPETVSKETVVALDLWFGNVNVAYVITSSGSFEYFDGRSWAPPSALELTPPLEGPGVRRGQSNADSAWIFSRSDSRVGFFQRGDIQYADTGGTGGVSALAVLDIGVLVGMTEGELFRQSAGLGFERIGQSERGAPIVHIAESASGKILLFDEDGAVGAFIADASRFCTPVATGLENRLTKVKFVALTEFGLFVGGPARQPNGTSLYRLSLEEN